MAKRIICFALGGHISSQNASFRKLAEILIPRGYEFYGAEDGFKAFETGNAHVLRAGDIPTRFAGFVAGAGRETLTGKQGIDSEKMQRAVDFFRRGKFDIAIGSGGDDHGVQMALLKNNLEGKVGVYVLNKTIDDDLGGRDGEREAPYTDFTNGYHTAVTKGVEFILEQFSGAWTNNLPYLIGHFGRETNWIGIALAYWGLADKIIYGELPEEHEGHTIEKVHELILEAQDRNEKRFGRRFAMIIVPEGTRISGFQHIAKELIDPHGHHKLQPEVLVTHLKTELEKQFGLKTQTLGITYEMRNSPPTPEDFVFAEKSARTIADAILRGETGSESVFRIRDGIIEYGVASIERVSEKRYASYYPKPLINTETFEVTEEIGRYYSPLFGKRGNLADFLPARPRVVNVFSS